MIFSHIKVNIGTARLEPACSSAGKLYVPARPIFNTGREPVKFAFRNVTISSIVALAAIVFFCAALALAIVSFPPGFTQLENWMSDLGNPGLNPDGAKYFNNACMITGLLLVIFYPGLRGWTGAGGAKAFALTAALVAGVFSGIALAGVGLFPETFKPHHFIVSVLFFLSSTVAILLTTVALRGHAGFSKTSALAGSLAVGIGIIFALQMALLPEVTALEWISVFSMLLWAAMISRDMLKARGRQALY
jgi:hypothetical membrane protein